MNLRLRCAIVLSAPAIAAPLVAAQPRPSCTQPLATATATERSYVNLNVRDFEGRVFFYVPEIKSSRNTFDPFQLWVVEGIYGRPFIQSSGSMDSATFERLRKSTNIRATALNVRGASESARATISRKSYVLELTVNVAASGADSVTARICRAP
jgi:hypothetical protein